VHPSAIADIVSPAAKPHLFIVTSKSLSVVRLADHFLRDDDRLRGTFAPARRAWDKPMAIACLRLFTFFPDRPLRSVPLFLSRIAFSTFSDAFLPYLATVVLLQNDVTAGVGVHEKIRA